MSLCALCCADGLCESHRADLKGLPLLEGLLADLSHLVLQAYYYCAIVEDVILRFAWTIQISLTSMQIFPYAGDIISTVFAPLEVFR